MSNEMTNLSDRTELLIQSLTNAVMGTADKVIQSAEQVVQISTDAAMARIDASVEFAQMKATLGLRLAEIEAIGKQRKALLDMRAASDGEQAKVRLLDFHLEILTAREAGVLEAAGVPRDKALNAIADTDTKLYRREGRAFQRAE
jgi:hypothetical protein